MIVKVTRRESETMNTYTVEYDSGKCKRYYHQTKAIIDFIFDKQPTITKCSNGTVRIYVWE